MTRAYPYIPGVPAAGHISGGYWHPGRIDGCPKCQPPTPPRRNPMPGLHECPHCHYRFEDAESLRRHLEEGRGCPEEETS